MSYRIFKRQVWRPNPSWPKGFEPLATPMDTCKTLATVYDRQEAIEFCDEHNAAWRKLGYASGDPKYFKAYRYEWTEV